MQLGEVFMDIRDVIPDILVDLRYATERNISGVPQYRSDMEPILRREVAFMLRESQVFLQKRMGKEYSLLVWDAGRPQSVQESMYEWCEQNGMS
jgi:D-alanyl-D-alanine dipeptidase